MILPQTPGHHCLFHGMCYAGSLLNPDPTVLSEGGKAQGRMVHTENTKKRKGDGCGLQEAELLTHPSIHINAASLEVAGS